MVAPVRGLALIGRLEVFNSSSKDLYFHFHFTTAVLFYLLSQNGDIGPVFSCHASSHKIIYY